MSFLATLDYYWSLGRVSPAPPSPLLWALSKLLSNRVTYGKWEGER